MDKKNEKTSAEKSGVEDWNALLQNSLGPIMESWQELLQVSGAINFEESKGRSSESLNTTFKMFQKFAHEMGTCDFAKVKEMFDVTPDIAHGFTNTCFQGFVNVLEHAGEWIQKRGKTLSVGDMQELDRELLAQLAKIYDAEFRRYLQLPQLGLGRIYQERALRALDKLNTLQLVLSEFLHLLYLPIEQSLTSLQKEILRLAEDGGADERIHSYYKLWISFLEGHYMELFKRPEYSDVMGKTILALNDFVQAKQVLVNDALKQANIPTNTDFDELSKEIYLLKKKIRLLEKSS